MHKACDQARTILTSSGGTEQVRYRAGVHGPAASAPNLRVPQTRSQTGGKSAVTRSPLTRAAPPHPCRHAVFRFCFCFYISYFIFYFISTVAILVCGKRHLVLLICASRRVRAVEQLVVCLPPRRAIFGDMHAPVLCQALTAWFCCCC